MKKGGTFLLLTITLVFAAFTAGILIGRHTNQGSVSVYISTTPSTEEVVPEATSLESDASYKLNINTATLAQLDTLPGIGPTLAMRIIDYRNEHGLFVSLSDLSKVEGIGAQKLLLILDMITLED